MKSRKYTLKTNYAYLIYSYQNLAEMYNKIPIKINTGKIICIEVIRLNKHEDMHKGYGAELMNIFLNSSVAKNAELIYLEINPHTGFEYVSFTSIKKREKIVNKLEKYYKSFGFINKDKHGLMWLINNNISINDLPL